MRRRARSRHSRENERARRAARSRIARMHVIAHALAKNVPSDRYLNKDTLHDRVLHTRFSISSYPLSGMLPLGHVDDPLR